MELIDIRGKHLPPFWFRGRRSVESVVGVTLHQTACILKSTVKRWGRVNIHIGVPRTLPGIIVNDPLDLIYHAQKLSKTTIGIEIEGTFEGIEGNPKTLWGKKVEPCHLTDIQLESLDLIFSWLLNWFDAHDREWTRIQAHRQSHKKRRSDPGSEIWQKVALDWADRLGIRGTHDGGDLWTIGKGRPIPVQWDLARSTDY